MRRRPPKKALGGNVGTLLLGILKDGRSYGYQIVGMLNARSQGLLRMGEGSVYPVLHRLEERGLISADWVVASSGRKRKYYYLTPRGRRTLAVSLQRWQALSRLMDAVLGGGTASPGQSAGGRSIRSSRLASRRPLRGGTRRGWSDGSSCGATAPAA